MSGYGSLEVTDGGSRQVKVLQKQVEEAVVGDTRGQ